MTDPASEATTSPASAPGSPVPGLVAELASFGLSGVDAHRAAFLALALAAGWPKARVARYLGISRARVGQKADKLRDYALDDGHPTPGLAALVGRADGIRLDGAPGQALPTVAAYIGFGAEDWNDLDFARGMCDIVSCP